MVQNITELLFQINVYLSYLLFLHLPELILILGKGDSEINAGKWEASLPFHNVR